MAATAVSPRSRASQISAVTPLSTSQKKGKAISATNSAPAK
jgi:hypothetical protein